ncbi:MAG: asparagine synthetase B [Magnetococcales bacterium]|nr:asparagine synthetase B [Magnetococcales bacterium]MBF0323215.1 asparagine synthetase B [Magnetococcales bacterium]
MCGIAATIGIRDADTFTTLFGALGHRGPDESGSAEGEGIHIGMHRLAIVGRVGDPLPLCGQGRWVLAFNGEIYNHQALRREFADYPFRTRSDGEVIFPLLARDGLAGLQRLRGMYAFILADLAGGDWVAVRDPYGIKPLYHARLAGGVALASELKAFASFSCQPQFLPPGHFLTARGGARWYRFPGRFPTWRRPSLRQLLEQAVASHLPESDPCGVFLSGGLDSSVIAALAARIRPDIVAYSVVLPGSPDEVPAAEVAAHLGIRHQVLRVTEEKVRTVLPDVIAALESFNPTMVRNAIPLYLLSQVASQACKVVLGGDGADELFAGYDYLARLPPREWPQAMEYGFNNLHRTELQRVDRVTMAHGLELRVPFLDQAVAERALNLPMEARLRRHRGEWVSKWVLREAAAGLLPPAIQWRQKLPLVEGSGVAGFDLARMQPAGGGDAAGWGGDDPESRAFFPWWRTCFPLANPNQAIWSDAGRYHDFTGYHGEPLLALFRR